ncbi:MAG: alpha/beta fold hydrolase [Candidatus Acidiferrum sp.]|jgi:pimeloyl-ACP methyl ester carboxylesterase
MKKSLAIFVHGINSNVECWKTLFDLFKDDPAITTAFDLLRFPYESKIAFGLFNPIQKIPEYGEIAKEFDTFVTENFTPAYQELYLVGHSQGGLVIQEWLVRRLNGGRGRELRRVREVLMIATPTLGSNIALGARKVLFKFLRNPQEERLRAFNSAAADTRRAIEQQVMNARQCDERNCPIPIVAFWGTEDNVVHSASAEASFDLSVALPGDHASVIRPQSREDLRYKEIAQALLVPVGHSHVYEIDSYETLVRVAPLAGDKQKFIAQRGGQPSSEFSDNAARIIRRVCFSPKNHCADPFRFNYQTNPKGYLVATQDMQPRELGEAVPHNEAGADEITDFAQSGTQFTYKFTPQPGRCHSQTLEIWNGFGAHGRDVHFHTGNNLRCRLYSFAVDLSAYASAGWKITEPQLFISPWDTGEHAIGEQRLPENRVVVSDAARPGVWVWNLANFRGGIVDSVWDVTPPAP